MAPYLIVDLRQQQRARAGVALAGAAMAWFECTWSRGVEPWRPPAYAALAAPCFLYFELQPAGLCLAFAALLSTAPSSCKPGGGVTGGGSNWWTHKLLELQATQVGDAFHDG